MSLKVSALAVARICLEMNVQPVVAAVDITVTTPGKSIIAAGVARYSRRKSD